MNTMARNLSSMNNGGCELPKVTLWLSRTDNGNGFESWKLERFVASSFSYNFSLAYNKDDRLTDVLRSDVVNAISDYLPKSPGKHILTAFDFLLELPGVCLSRLTCTGQEARNGVQRVLLKFQRTFGELRSLFRPNRAPDFLKEADSGVSTRVLHDMLVPILNLVDSEPIQLANQSQEQINALVGRLTESRHDIAFYARLMSRFIANAHQPSPGEHVDATLPALEPQRQLRGAMTDITPRAAPM